MIPNEIKISLIKGFFFALWLAGSCVLIWFILRYSSTLFNRQVRKKFIDRNVHVEKNRELILKDMRFFKNLSTEMDVARLKISLENLLLMMLILAVIMFFLTNAGVLILKSHFATGADSTGVTNVWGISIVASLLVGSLPYFFVKFKVQYQRHKIALKMIELVQNLIGYYRPRAMIVDVIKNCSETVPNEIREEWKVLEIAVQRNVKLGLYEFAERVENGRGWVDDLVETLIIGSEYGTDVSNSLHKLVVDMQTAKKNEENRIAMISVYRIGTVLMTGFAFFVVALNVYADENNYHNYFVDESGKKLILISIIVLFLSLLSVARSGGRQF